MDPFSLGGVASSVVSVLLRSADLCLNPSWSGAAALSNDGRQAAGRLRAFAQDTNAQARIAKRIEKRLADEVERLPQERRAALDGVAAAVETVLTNALASDEELLEVVRRPEDLAGLLRRQGRAQRDDLDAAAESAFDSLIEIVAGELAVIVPSSPSFDEAHARYVMDALDTIVATTSRTESMVEDVLSGQKEIFGRIDRLGGGMSGRRHPLGDGPVCFGAIPGRAPGYIARDEYRRLCDALADGGEATLSALRGMKGVGKSQIAAQYARDCRDAGWNLVAWINAAPAGAPDEGLPSGAETGLAELANQLGLVDPSAPPAKSARTLVDWLNSGEAVDRLIVFDNLERADDLRELQLIGPGLRVIVTTNLRGGVLGESIPVEVFSREQSKAFLQERLPGITDADADRLAGLLGDLPVALSQAVSTMKAEDYAPLEYMELLEEVPLEEAMDRSDGDDYPHAVWQALRLSHRTALEALGERDAEQARSAHLQLGMLSIMPEGGVPRDWLYYADGDHSRAARKSLAFLCERGIISKTENNITRAGVVSLHRLQSRVVREEVGRDGELGVIANAVISALVSVLNESDLDNPDDVGRNSIIAVIDSLSLLGGLDLDSVSVNVEKISDLLLLAQRRADEAGLASFAMSLVEIVNRVALKLGSDHPRTLSLYNNLAGAYVSAGTLDEAIRLDEQTLEDCLRVLGPDHPHTLTMRNNLAYAYQSAERLDEAILLFEQSLEESLKVLGADHSNSLTLRNNLASAYRSAGRLKEAIRLYEQTLGDRLRVLGVDHPDTFATRSDLAGAYEDGGRLSEALPLYEQALTGNLKVLGIYHPNTLTVRNNLAGAYRSAGRLDEAISLFEQTLEDCLKVLGTDNPKSLTLCNNLAGAYRSARRMGEAIRLYEQTLEGRIRVLGVDHPDTLASRNNLAGAYEFDGRMDEAITLFEHTLEDCLRVLGSEHPLTKQVAANLEPPAACATGTSLPRRTPPTDRPPAPVVSGACHLHPRATGR
ncbi:FxSxx-COOH system tetratricopeptide repeat protein [Actinomyces denticolens]|uniref:FxSxx-COOH system tetratricopeptide repeat protein n=1 Tax=Actinomyces denticolens TaxID=52767 RepID=UPI0013565B2C|nr:FxSxx-COOH system tetratricopeptide repeat protein [Actinomyces denticolens]